MLRRELPRPVRSGGEAGAVEQRMWDMRIVSLQTAQRGPGQTGGAQLLLVASDVTEQRAAEQARFDAAVSQREMLVKEVHHRIKNNLQGVAGLLQQTAARRPEVAALISEAVGQVQAIAQVHGLQVGVSGPLRILPLVEAITASVQRTFGRPISVSVQGTPAHRFALPEAESIPIALTVNELLTNAIKHSAPGDIHCVLHFDEARLVIQILSPGQLQARFQPGPGAARRVGPGPGAGTAAAPHGHPHAQPAGCAGRGQGGAGAPQHQRAGAAVAAQWVPFCSNRATPWPSKARSWWSTTTGWCWPP